jgi:hypothetical protein
VAVLGRSETDPMQATILSGRRRERGEKHEKKENRIPNTGLLIRQHIYLFLEAKNEISDSNRI